MQQTDYANLIAEARNAAFADAEQFMNRLDLNADEQTFVAGQAHKLFCDALATWEKWSEHHDLGVTSMTASLAVATQIADRLAHHIDRLLDEQGNA